MPKPARYPKANVITDFVEDYHERLAALWAVRLVLVAIDGTRFLRSKSHADDLLAVIGPWVEWPQAMRGIFARELRKLSNDAWDDDDDVEEDEPTLVGTPSSAASIDWSSVDWKALNRAFCSIYARQPSRVVNLLKTTVKKLETQPPDDRDPLFVNLERLSNVLGLCPVEHAVLQCKTA